MKKNLAETNWKEKDSRMVLATSLNLDELDQDYENKLKKDKTDNKYFEFENEYDQTFDINRIDKSFSRDAPDFVFNLKIIYLLI